MMFERTMIFLVSSIFYLLQDGCIFWAGAWQGHGLLPAAFGGYAEQQDPDPVVSDLRLHLRDR